MEERTRTIQHKGINIWYSDYSELQGSELVDMINLNIEKYMAWRSGPDSTGLALLNVNNAVLHKDAIEAFKKSGSVIRPHQQAVAVVGVKGMKGVIIDWVSFLTKVKIKTFDEMQKALDWLIEQ